MASQVSLRAPFWPAALPAVDQAFPRCLLGRRRLRSDRGDPGWCATCAAVGCLNPHSGAGGWFIHRPSRAGAVLRQASGGHHRPHSGAASVGGARSRLARATRPAVRPLPGRRVEAANFQVLAAIEGLVDLGALRGRLEKDIPRREGDQGAGRPPRQTPNFAGKAPPRVGGRVPQPTGRGEPRRRLGARGRLGGFGPKRLFPPPARGWRTKRRDATNRPVTTLSCQSIRLTSMVVVASSGAFARTSGALNRQQVLT